MKEFKKKLKEILNEELAKQIILDLTLSKQLSFKVNPVINKEEEYLLKTNDGKDILTFSASRHCSSLPNAISALRDLSLEIGEKHLPKNQIEKLVQIN